MSGRCPACGRSGLPAGSAYCLACGAELEVRPGGHGPSYTPLHLSRDVLVSRHAIEGERKEVTVLIGDVAGSLAMADALDPEDVHELMDGFFALVAEAVHREGGTINQYRGDGFMALFGAPRARGDDPARGLRAALALRDSAARYTEAVRARFGVRFALRMGVNTGFVWVGAIGGDLRRDYTAEGPTVGVAARLEALAEPGQILVGGETALHAARSFRLQALGAQEVRGLSEPVEIFELVAEDSAPSRFRGARGRGLLPLVGREGELERLRARIPRSQGLEVIEVRGEAGIGKSRLLHAFLERLPPGMTRLELHARESSSQRAFVPWLDLLRGGTGFGSPLPQAEAILRRCESEAWPQDGAADIEEAARAALEAAGSGDGAVVLVEDAQWLDPSSRRLIRSLAERPPAGAILIAAAVRGGSEAGSNEDWGAPPGTERIQLGGLSPAAAHALAFSVLEGTSDPEDLAELAVRRGGGNPLFVEEVARALMGGTETLREAARLEAALHRSPVRVPTSLHGVVAARIDALPERAKRLIEAAAVIDYPFDALLVEEVGEDEGVTEVLSGLVEEGLLHGLSGERFEFAHGILREVAYVQLVRRRREALHRGSARALEARPLARTAEGASRIGSHWDAAGEGARAAPYLIRAGKAYAALDAPGEGATHLRRALELLRGQRERDLDEEAGVALLLATCLGALDQTAEAAALLEGIDELSVGSGDRERYAMASIQSGWLRFMHHGDLPGGRRLIEKGLSAIDDVQDGYRAATLGHSYLGRMHSLDGSLAEALHHSRKVVELAAGRTDRMGEVMALYNQVFTLCDAGRLAEARLSAERALDLARGEDRSLLGGLANTAMAKVALFEGDAEGALGAARRGISGGTSAQQRGLLHTAEMLRGYAHIFAGEPRRAHEAFERMLEFDDGWPATLLHRARGFLEIGEFGEAICLAERCLGLEPPRMLRVRALGVLGLASGLMGDQTPELGESAVSESISLSDQLGLYPYLGEAHMFLAELVRIRGDAERAAYYAERAAATFDSCGMAAYAARARELAPPSGVGTLRLPGRSQG